MEFASRISITCFAASYAVGMVHEILRIFWPTRPIRWLATGASLAGVFAHTLFVIAMAWHDGRVPIASQFQQLIVVSWLISLIYVYLLVRERRLAAGIFILPISLSLVLYATVWADRTQGVHDKFKVLATAHGVLLLGAVVLVVLSLVAAGMYLVKNRQLKSGQLSRGIRLPSLERLDKANTHLVYLAWPLLTAGIVCGFILRQLQWNDPKVLVTMLAWTGFTILAHYRFQPANRGQRVAWMTIIAGSLVLFSLLGDPLLVTHHLSPPGDAK